MEYRYILESYTGPASRTECPACHQKRVFVRYIDTETKQYLSPDAGRCNREEKCRYHYTPKQYFHDHPTEKPEFSEAIKKGQGYGKAGIQATESRSLKIGAAHSKITARSKPESFQQEPGRIPKEYLIKALGYNSNFIRFLCTLFDRYDIESPTIKRLMREYYLGCTKSGAVIYWQIDGGRRIRTGKIMQYNPETGKRIKKESGAIDWVHANLKKRGILPDDFNLMQCLFGEHLLKHQPEATVCLVEGEKSAVIGSGMMPGYIWLATGGKSNLKPETCRCLKGRDVILFPDLGAFDDWKVEGERIAAEVGCRIQVSDLLEQSATDTDRNEGCDVADYLIRQLRAAIVETEPVKVPVRPLNREEQALQHLGSLNPKIYTLIDALGLISATTGERLRTQIN